jgi:hypothetical protein
MKSNLVLGENCALKILKLRAVFPRDERSGENAPALPSPTSRPQGPYNEQEQHIEV